MRVVGYVRVSTDRQVDFGAGLDVQRKAVRAWCRTHSHRLVALVADEGVSGTLADRPALAEALALLREGKAGGLVVHRLDRLARDLVLQEQLLAECWRMGASVSSTAAGEDAYLSDDPADPSRRLIRQILGAVSDYERSMVRLRLATGRRHKAEAGGYAYGSPPFGFRSERGELVPRMEEQPALARITELHAARSSLREIARALTAEGFAARGGGLWHPGVLSRIVSRLPPA
jgi:DNA invertase Pin-like site-specific DNA recombinase